MVLNPEGYGQKTQMRNCKRIPHSFKIKDHTIKVIAFFKESASVRKYLSKLAYSHQR